MSKRKTHRPPPSRADDANSAVTVAELVADPINRRRHTSRNLEMIATALRTVGASRSIVIDERNEVLAGNGVLEAAGAAGISRVQVIDADGETIIAVRRTGLTPDQKTALALYDNRTAELAEWNVAQLSADAANGIDLTPFFTEDELAKLFGPVAPDAFKSVDINVSTNYCCPSCGYQWSGNPKPATSAALTPSSEIEP